MPSRYLFEPISEQVIRQSLAEERKAARRAADADYNLAIDYLDGRQIEDVRSELSKRYKSTQSAPTGQTIEPVAVPLVQRFVSESATLYNRPVTRTLTDENGEESEATQEATAQLNSALEECSYNEQMHRLDKIVVLLRSCGLWYQAKRGKLRPVVVYPQQVYPVAGPQEGMFAPEDQGDYLGFVLRVDKSMDDPGAIGRQMFALLAPAETAYYSGTSPYDLGQITERYPNPYRWQQMVDTDDQRGSGPFDLPLQMLTIWHKEIPQGQLIVDTDADLAMLNREINIQLAVMLDTMRVQGFSQLVLSTLNPEAPPRQFNWGSRFAMSIQSGESAQMMSSPNNYQGLVDALQAVVQIAAIAHRQSTNDFAVSGQSPQSGFAKLVDSLPKLEARSERAARMKASEEQLAWPRICAVLKYLGKIRPDADRMRLRVKFADVEFPQTVDELARKQEHEFAYGLSSPADVLAEKHGMTREAALERIAENKQQSAKPQQEEPQQQRGSLLGSLIGRPGAAR